MSRRQDAFGERGLFPCLMLTFPALHFVSLDMSFNTSPTGPLRKHLSTGTAGLGLGSGDHGRSLSPVPMAALTKGKSAAVPASGSGSGMGSKMLGETFLLRGF